MSDLRPVGHLVSRLQQARSLPGTLAVTFDAFEAIRVLARQSQDRVPELFAAFMTTADAAVDGRESGHHRAVPPTARPEHRSASWLAWRPASRCESPRGG